MLGSESRMGGTFSCEDLKKNDRKLVQTRVTSKSSAFKNSRM